MEFSLQADHLSKVYNGQAPAVNDITLRVRPSEFLTILGPSGGGKTTALRLLAGFEKPSSGRIQIGENIVADETRFVPPEQRKVGMVFQDYALFPHVTVAENIAFGIRKSGKSRQPQVERLLSLVGLTAYAERMPHELSGGEQQRVAIARAFASRPRVLFADEPTGNLDTATGGRVAGLLFDLNREAGTTLVLVTHDAALASRCGDVITLEAGRMRAPAPEPRVAAT